MKLDGSKFVFKDKDFSYDIISFIMEYKIVFYSFLEVKVLVAASRFTKKVYKFFLQTTPQELAQYFSNFSVVIEAKIILDEQQCSKG